MVYITQLEDFLEADIGSMSGNLLKSRSIVRSFVPLSDRSGKIWQCEDAHELDCSVDRVCNRGSTGVVTYQVSMPIPARRDDTCNAQIPILSNGG